MIDMYILSEAMEQEVHLSPQSEEALVAEWHIADTAGVVGPRLRAALRCAVFDDPVYRERAMKLEKILNDQEVQDAANH